MSLGVSASSFWLIFNTLQAIEILSLIEVDYPDILREFFDGLEFTLLIFPEEWNPFNMFDGIKPPTKDNIEGNIGEGGFYSPFFVVQQVAFIILVATIALMWTIWSLCLYDRVRHNTSVDIEEEEKLEEVKDGD